MISVIVTPDVLSPREQQVTNFVAEGLTNKAISLHMHVTEGTVKQYLNRIFPKVGVSNRTMLAGWWIASGGMV